jgi:uncharacterized protein
MTITTIPIDLPQEKISEFCQQWQIKELSLFGSILRDDFNENSDIDWLVTFNENSQWSLIDLVIMQEQLTKILGRKVDFIEKKVIENSPNWLRKKEILSTAKPYYVKR